MRLWPVYLSLGGVLANIYIGLQSDAPLQLAPPERVRCHALDGDTLRCGDLRIRLAGIDAAELPGHCHPQRRCAPGNAHRQRAALESFASNEILYEAYSVDRYDRPVAIVRNGDGDNASCVMLRHGAKYMPEWDPRFAVALECLSVARRTNSATDR